MPGQSLNEQLWEFLLSGGFFMAFIVGCSLVAVAVSIHRAISLRWAAVFPRALAEELARCHEYFKQHKTSRLYAFLRQSDSPMGRISRVALAPDFADRETAGMAVEAHAREEMVKLEHGMGVLEVVITIAPLLGLLGTVSGLVSVFATLGGGGDVADPTAIAAGIAVALNTTIAGLVVAVITVIFHSFFTRRLSQVAARMEVVAGGVLHDFYKMGGPRLYSLESDQDAGRVADPAVARSIQQSAVQLEDPRR